MPATAAFRISRDAPWGWSAGVTAIWFSAGLAVLLALTGYLRFVWEPTPGLHSWVTERRHPIQQQIFWFHALILGAPLAVLAGHFLWAALASLLTRRGWPNAVARRVVALSFAPLLGVWLPLSRLDAAGSLAALRTGALTSAVLLVLAAALSRFVPATRLAGPAEPDDVSSDPAPVVRGEPRRAVRALRLLFVLVLLPIDLYLACFDPRIRGAVDLFHEGEQLVPLMEVLGGGLPYRDVYLQHGFLENVAIPWLGAKLFAPTLAGVRWMDALVAPLGEVGAYALLVALTGARVLPAVLFAVLVVASPTAVSGRAFFGLLSLATIAWTLRTPATPLRVPATALRVPATPLRVPSTAATTFSRGASLFFFAGVLATAAFLHSTEVGLYSLATGFVFLAIAGAANLCPSGTKPLLAFAAGAFVAFLPFAIALAACGILDDFALNFARQTRYQLEVWGKPFPSPFDTFLPLVSGESTAASWADRRFWWYLCPALLAITGSWLAHSAMRGRIRCSPSAAPLLLLSIAAAFYFRSVLGRSDRAHLQYGVLFPLMVAVFVADASWQHGRSLLASGPLREKSTRYFFRLCSAFLAGAAVAVLALAWVDRAARPALGVAHAWNELIPGRKRITFDAALATSDIVPERQLRRLDELKEFLAAETTPDERILDFTNQAGRLFFAGRRSATRCFQIVYATPPEMQQEIVDQLEAGGTRFALLRPEGLRAKSDGVPYRKRYALVAEYVTAHFSPFRSVGGVEVWKRNDTGSGSPTP